MEELLRQLLNRLEEIGRDHEELYDTDCREQMSDAVMSSFVRATNDLALPDTFGLYTAGANTAVREALSAYIDLARSKATDLGLHGFHDRLAAFQNQQVTSDEQGNFYDDYFGYSDPKNFDESGNVID